MAAWKQVECEMCRTEFVALLLDRAETGDKLDLGASTVLPVVETELAGAVKCPNPDCEEVFLVPEFEVPRLPVDGVLSHSTT